MKYCNPTEYDLWEISVFLYRFGTNKVKKNQSI